MSTENKDSHKLPPDELHPAENKTLSQQSTIDEHSEKTTQTFETPAKKVSTDDEQDSETEPTRILPVNSFEYEDDLSIEPDENSLEPSRLRFTLICLLFVFAVAYLSVNFYKPFLQSSNLPEWSLGWNGEQYVVTSIGADFAGQVQVGDEILSIENQPIDKRYKYRQLFRKLEANKTYQIQFRRDHQIYEIQFTPKSLPFSHTVNVYLLNAFIPAVFLLTGVVVFLFKPNNKLIVLVAVSFSLLAMSIAPPYVISYFEDSLFISYTWQFGNILELLNAPLLLHFFLLFPKPSVILQRFPKIQFLIYVPFLLYVVPVETGQGLAYSGLTGFDTFLDYQLLDLVDFFFTPYLFFDLILLIISFRNADEQGRRKIRVFLVGVAFAIAPFVLNDLILTPIESLIDTRLFSSADWRLLATNGLAVLAPPVFAYAIVYHQVIPISFIIRRGLQYVLAKNALRLFLFLPILGISWNIAANPNRTLSEILLNNTSAFYSFVIFAAVLVLFNRFGLREWIDKRFFREQYNQEQILRELIEAVKVSDSRAKLSRLVSSKIQSALHPTSVYLFFQENRNSDFSLGYTTSESSANLKLVADSPLLHFLQQERGTIEFPTRQTDELPNREKRWLREINSSLLVPMRGTDDKLAGFFSLGEKMSQIPYTQRDKELLEMLANQIALVHENLSLKEHMRREQKIKHEVLARFEEGNINLLKECPTCGKCFDREMINCSSDNSKLTFSLPVERTLENRYCLEKLLGRGGMGAVYEAADLRLNRIVAVKILSGAKFGNRDALRRFEREAQSAGRLHHRNIVTIFDYGTLSTEGAFLVMERVHGRSLTEVLRCKGKLDLQTVTAWFGQILDGVETAHKAGIIHRDLKPDNIFVVEDKNRDTRLCILDFGLARLNEAEIGSSSNVTIPGMIMGTLGYMSPEQLRGDRVDERTDLFAVGVMIYEALFGEKPFRGQTYQEIRQAMMKEISFDSDRSKKDFFKQALAISPAHRFASAGDMKSSLLHL